MPSSIETEKTAPKTRYLARWQLLGAIGLVAMLGACAVDEPDPIDDESTTSDEDALNANEKAAYQFFVAKGLKDYQAAGVVGNLIQESNVNPESQQYGGPGRGIAQWSVGGRWDHSSGDNAVWFASKRGQSVHSLNLQLEFVWYELQTFPGYGLGPLKSSTNIADATRAFQNKFEICGQCEESQRISYAKQVLAAYGGSSPDPTPAPPPEKPSINEVAFQANTGSLWTTGSAGTKNWSLGMMAGTSPSIAALDEGGYVVAFQANTGELWTAGTGGVKNWHLGMMAGTSPSITALSGGGYEIAFQANTTNLWTVGSAGNKDWSLGMMKGTSPSITTLSNGGFQVAFQANTSNLWTVGSAGNKDWKLGMATTTSPSITALAHGGFEVAFQANTGSLWTAGSLGVKNWSLGMMHDTNPAIAALTGGGFEVAFQANTSSLWSAGNAGTKNWGLGMMTGTSPSISATDDGGYRMQFQANTGSLWKAGEGGTGAMDLGMKGGTSPSGT